jgi:hypothetical protein
MSNSGSLQRPLPPLAEDFPLKQAQDREVPQDDQGQGLLLRPASVKRSGRIQTSIVK